MVKLISSPSRIETLGTRLAVFDEYIGVVNTGDTGVSIMHVRSPAGWQGTGQWPAFDQYSVVFKGTLRAEHEGGSTDAVAGQAIHSVPGEWVRYSTPLEGGAEFIAVCTPAYTRANAHHDE